MGETEGQQLFEICPGYRGHIGYGVMRCWCDGSRGEKEWSISYQSEKKKELAVSTRAFV